MKHWLSFVFVSIFCGYCYAASVMVGPSGGFITTAGGSGTSVVNRNGAATYKLVCHGDSFTVAQTAPPGYCAIAATTLATNRSITVAYKSFGLSGYSWNYAYLGGPPPLSQATLNSLAPSQIYTECVPWITNTILMFAGTNGIFLGGHSAATEFADFQTGFNGITTAGCVTASHVGVITTVPRQDSASFDTTRATYNSSLASFCVSNGCFLVPAGTDANIGCNGCEDNTACFLSDKIHLGNTGTCGGVSGGGMAYLASIIVPLLP